MKKTIRMMLCAALLTVALCVPAFAAEQGDFDVLLNGQEVSFTDAVPQIRNDRSYLPFVAVFEQLGFAQEDMTWDADTATVTATREDLTISLTIGQKSIALVQDGQTTDIVTDVAPYIDPALSRTYIPLGLVADALGYRVGWDGGARVVIIDDIDAILAANTSTYSLMDQMMVYQNSFSQKNQKVTGSYGLELNMDMDMGEAQTTVFTVDGDYTMHIAKQSDFDFTTKMDIAATVNGEDMLATMEEIPAVIDMQMRGSMTTGLFYFQSNAISQMVGMENVWFKLDYAALFAQMSDVMGMDYASFSKLLLVSNETSFDKSLETLLRTLPLNNAAMTSTDLLALINTIAGDEAFTRTGNNYVNRIEQDGAVITFTLYRSGSRVTGYAMEISAEDPSFGSMSIVAGMQGKEMEMTMTMQADMEGLLSLSVEMIMDGKYADTTVNPQTAPPAGAAVLDLMSMMTGLPAAE